MEAPRQPHRAPYRRDDQEVPRHAKEEALTQTHPKTGHEHRTPKPENYALPERIKIDLVWEGACWTEAEGFVCPRGTKGCDYDHDSKMWFAELSGDLNKECDTGVEDCYVIESLPVPPTCQKGVKGCILRHGRTCEKGTPNCKTRHEWQNTTFGDTMSQALYMAFDLLKMLNGECSPEKEWDGEHFGHCFCRDTTYSRSGDEKDEVVRYVKCCRCETSAPATEFEHAEDRGPGSLP